MKHQKKRVILFIIMIISALFLLSACSKNDNHGLSANNPTDITVWHYYNGTLAIAFDELVGEFNNTIGRENGVVVYPESMSSVTDLESALWDAANEKVGAPKMPNIFQCYPDNAVTLDGVIQLVDLDKYVSAEEKSAYVKRFLDDGCIGTDNAWKLFPIAKSTEVLMLNKTDWDKFAADTGASTEELATWEGLAQVAEAYYEWSGGKAFFGRDAFANYPIIGSLQLGHEIFQVSDGTVTLDFDKETMRKIWDCFYVPYVKGYYLHKGKFRSDDTKLGDIIALVCSTSSASYFPSEVTPPDGSSYAIEYMILPLPSFAGTTPYAVMQGAGMAVTEASEAEIYASILFLKWLTQEEQNLHFSIDSGYLPVTETAIQIDTFDNFLAKNNTSVLISDTLHVALNENQNYIMYAPKGFEGATPARNVLNTTMVDLAVNDRAAIEAGASIDAYLTDGHFNDWYNDTLAQLQEYCR